MDSYLDLINISIDDIQTKIIIFGSVTLENGAIICANSNYHKKPWFSNIAIVMDSEEFFDYVSDKGVCYGQVIILFYFIITYDIQYINYFLNIFKVLLIVYVELEKGKPPLNLSLI